MSSPDVARIAEGLTKAQRSMLSNTHEGAIGDGWFVFLRNGPSSKIIGNLHAKGLSEPHRINIHRLTPLGLSVRQYLEEQGK